MNTNSELKSRIEELEAENERQAKRIRQIIDGHFKSFNYRNRSIKAAYTEGFEYAREWKWCDLKTAWKQSGMAKMLRRENIHKREGRG